MEYKFLISYKKCCYFFSSLYIYTENITSILQNGHINKKFYGAALKYNAISILHAGMPFVVECSKCSATSGLILEKAVCTARDASAKPVRMSFNLPGY